MLLHAFSRCATAILLTCLSFILRALHQPPVLKPLQRPRLAEEEAGVRLEIVALNADSRRHRHDARRLCAVCQCTVNIQGEEGDARKA